MRRTILAIVAVIAAQAAIESVPAQAGIVRTPECAAKLARADALVSAVAKRTYVTPAPTGAALCQVLRANLREMREARDHMNQCMTGHEQRENVGQMDVSMVDIRAVIARRC